MKPSFHYRPTDQFTRINEALERDAAGYDYRGYTVSYDALRGDWLVQASDTHIFLPSRKAAHDFIDLKEWAQHAADNGELPT